MKPQSQPAHTSSPRIFFIPISIVVIALTIASANAQSFKVVHNFTGGHDGGDPLNGFTSDAAGNLYATASAGGLYNNGNVYKINPKGGESILHSFKGGVDGAAPQGFLVRDSAGNFYGTTSAGGATGNGTVFEMTASKHTVLYSFAGGTDGSGPQAGLAIDAAGNLYGTTAAGGKSGNGSVFELSPPSPPATAWTESVLYSFLNGSDGKVPVGGVSLDAAGNLYGTTSAGGSFSYGTVFELTKASNWSETILHNFQNSTDGAVPYAGLVADGLGNFYGAATEGGSNGGGTIYELTPSGNTWNFAPISSVPGWGISGSFRNVVLDSSGNIYGTTHCDGNNNSGTVYELTPSGGSWNYTLLYTFTGGDDGLYSYSNLVLSQGKLYGTTKYGGTKNSGVVFEVTP